MHNNHKKLHNSAPQSSLCDSLQGVPLQPNGRFYGKNQTVSAVNPFVCRRYSDKRQITFRHRASIITAISYHTKKFVSTFIYTNLKFLSKIFMLLWFAFFLKRVKTADNRLIGGDLKKKRYVFAVDGKKNYRKIFQKAIDKRKKMS